jgi:hypothetical protein
MTEKQKKELIQLIHHSTIHQIFRDAKVRKYDVDIVFSLISQVGIDYVLDSKLGINGLPQIEPEKTIQDIYKELWNLHYKFLTKNHMSEDGARRLATIHAVENTWKEYNQRKPKENQNGT